MRGRKRARRESGRVGRWSVAVGYRGGKGGEGRTEKGEEGAVACEEGRGRERSGEKGRSVVGDEVGGWYLAWRIGRTVMIGWDVRMCLLMWC